jgi:hypothetical protein
MLSNVSVDDDKSSVDSGDESTGGKGHVVGIETASLPEGLSALVREQSSRAGSRRNTGVRKHSPSTASEHPPLPTIQISEASMQELTERFESIRNETEEIVAQVAKEAEEHKSQLAELLSEKDEKQILLKDKEAASEKLKKEVNTSERANRQAQNKKSQKEKTLRDKQAERDKVKEDMARWQKEIEEMHTEKQLWEKEKLKIAADTERKVEEMRVTLRKRQNSLNAMEEEIRQKGLQIKELEDERQALPGADDEEAKAAEATEKEKDRAWDIHERELMAKFNANSIRARNLEIDLQKAQAYFAHLSAQQASNPIMYQQNNAISTGVDYDANGPRPKARRNRQRKSRTNTISSLVAAYPNMDTVFPPAAAYNNITSQALPSPNFAPGPYFDPNVNAGLSSMSDHSGMSDADITSLTAGAPLSPTATNLLPSNIFFDDDDVPDNASRNMGQPILGPAFDAELQQSPESSSRSASLFNSPRTSQPSLQLFKQTRDSFGEEARNSSARQSLGSDFGAIGSPNTNPMPPPKSRLGELFTFSNKQRAKTMQEGPALGTLKAGQSQSFNEAVSETNKNRRTSFSAGWSGLPFLNRGHPTEASEGNGPVLGRSGSGSGIARRRRAFGMWGSSIDDPTAAGDDGRSPGSPRPASIASSDLPRPSSESAPFGWAPSMDREVGVRNSPLATNWSLNLNRESSALAQPWSTSRSTSRRPSILNGSTTNLNPSGFVLEEDEILPTNELGLLDSPPPNVGVIGTRPPSQMSTGPGAVNPTLNPTAPTFKVSLFEKLSGKSGDKPDKDAKKDKKEKKSKKSKDKDAIPETSADDRDDDNVTPYMSRISRDGFSLNSLNSLHSLASSMPESVDSLERAVTGSDIVTTYSTISGRSGELSLVGKENSFQKLLRKGSSSKFSIGSLGSLRGMSKREREKAREQDLDDDTTLGSIPGFVDSPASYSPALGYSAEVTSSPLPDMKERKEKKDKKAEKAERKAREEKKRAAEEAKAKEDAKVGEGEAEDALGMETPDAKREGRMSVNWGRFSIKGKKKEGRTSVDVERSEADEAGDE